MPSPRYTVRLPEPLHTHVQTYLETTRTLFVTLVREALSAYLADKMPTGVPTFADSTDPLPALQAHVTELTARVKVIEDILTTWFLHADRAADTAPTGADSRADRPRPAQTDATPGAGTAGQTPPRRVHRGTDGGVRSLKGKRVSLPPEREAVRAHTDAISAVMGISGTPARSCHAWLT
jgi:hypothetical protein